MNNNQWFKLMFSVVDDTRMAILGTNFGHNEAMGMYVRLLKVFYKDYPEGIPWVDVVIDIVAERCHTDSDTLGRFVELACSDIVGWLAFVPSGDGVKLMSKGVAKESLQQDMDKENGGKDPKPGSRPRGRPRKSDEQ